MLLFIQAMLSMVASMRTTCLSARTRCVGVGALCSMFALSCPCPAPNRLIAQRTACQIFIPL